MSQCIVEPVRVRVYNIDVIVRTKETMATAIQCLIFVLYSS